jgi:hypothetical protein
MPNSATTGSINSRKPLLVNTVGKAPEKVAVAPDTRAHLRLQVRHQRGQVPLLRPQQRQPLAQRLLKADFAGHAAVGEGFYLAHARGAVGLPLQGNVSQLIQALDLRKRGVEIENEVGQGRSSVGHGRKDGAVRA